MANADTNQYLAEMQGALNAQGSILPQQAGMEMRLAPALQQAQMAGLQGQATGLMGLYGNLYGQSQQFQNRYAGDQMSLMAGLAPQATAAAIGSLDATTQGIYGTYGRQVLSDLQMGRGLSAQETNMAQQSARAAAQARGLQFSRQGSDLEVLNTYQMGQQRYQQRQQAALSGYQMGQQQQAYGAQTFLNPSLQQSAAFSLPGMVAQSSQMYGSLGQNFLQPESQYLANIRANRIQQENADAAASAQRSAGLMGGLGQMLGTAVGIGLRK
jgi:hypothetical protein